jgi:hypothetical protein
MSTAKLVLDEELGQLADLRGPTRAEAYILLELREARSVGEAVVAFRGSDGHYTLGPMQVLATKSVHSQRRRQTHWARPT